MVYFKLLILSFFTFFYFSAAAEESKLLGGCVIGIVEVMKAHQKNFPGLNESRLKIFKDECNSLISNISKDKSLEEKNAEEKYPFESGCGLGASAALRTLKGKKWASEMILDRNKLITEVKKYCQDKQ